MPIEIIEGTCLREVIDAGHRQNGTEVAKSAIWAYVAYDDRPKFEIRGFLPGDELAYLAKTFDLHNPVGTWLEDTDMGGLWAITDDDGTLYLAVFGRSGLRTSKRALTELREQNGRVFVRTARSRAGDSTTRD